MKEEIEKPERKKLTFDESSGELIYSDHVVTNSINKSSLLDIAFEAANHCDEYSKETGIHDPTIRLAFVNGYMTCKNALQKENESLKAENAGLPLQTQVANTNNQIIEAVISELLAVLHGDGGHYTQKHGIIKSINDACELIHIKWVSNEHLVDINEVIKERDQLKAELSEKDRVIDALRKINKHDSNINENEINELKAEIKVRNEIISDYKSKIEQLDALNGASGDAEGYARICGQEVLLKRLIERLS